MRLTIDPFDKESIKAALAQIEQYKRDFEVKEIEFARRLAEIGVRLARDVYSIADPDGPNDIVVQMLKIPGGYAVLASGETVGFIEFGTGVNNPEWSGKHLGYTPPPRGSYGKGQGARPSGWWYKPNEGARAVHTKGIPPAEAMLTARDEMVARAIEIAREVWK